MTNQKKNSPRKKYLLQFSPFFWRLGKIDDENINKDSQLRPVFVKGKKSI
ncbi:hypothetical protein [Flagellimonas lutimaris]